MRCNRLGDFFALQVSWSLRHTHTQAYEWRLIYRGEWTHIRPLWDYKTEFERFGRTNTSGSFPRPLFLKILLSRTGEEWLLSRAFTVFHMSQNRTGRDQRVSSWRSSGPAVGLAINHDGQNYQSKIKGFAHQKPLQMCVTH